jgi:hypothetical protein
MSLTAGRMHYSAWQGTRTGVARSKKKTLILSQHADRQFVEEAKKIGVRAYVAKIKAIEAAVIGEDFVLVE